MRSSRASRSRSARSGPSPTTSSRATATPASARSAMSTPLRGSSRPTSARDSGSPRGREPREIDAVADHAQPGSQPRSPGGGDGVDGRAHADRAGAALQRPAREWPARGMLVHARRMLGAHDRQPGAARGAGPDDLRAEGVELHDRYVAHAEHIAQPPDRTPTEAAGQERERRLADPAVVGDVELGRPEQLGQRRVRRHQRHRVGCAAVPGCAGQIDQHALRAADRAGDDHVRHPHRVGSGHASSSGRSARPTTRIPSRFANSSSAASRARIARASASVRA